MSEQTKLISQLRVKCYLDELIPDNNQERIAWLEKFGPVVEPSERECVLLAPAADWADVGLYIETDGSARGYGTSTRRGVRDVPTPICDEIVAFLRTAVAEDGNVPALAPADEIISAARARRQLDTEREEQRRKDEAARAAAGRLASEKEKAEKAERAAKARVDMEVWIAAHGSARLRRCLAEGIECAAIYRDERMAAERPGWVLDLDGNDSEPRNPPDEAFALLDEARKTAPDAKLNYLTYEDQTDEETGDVTAGWRGYVAQAEFLGRTIRYGGPAE
jgi:hypothetical protein